MVTIWGFNFIVIRWGLDEVPPLTLTVLRFALAAFPALLFVRPPATRWYWVAGYGLFAFALQFALLFGGMAAGMPTGLASLVIQVQVFFTMGWAALFMNERTRPAQLAGAAVAGAGLILVAVHLPASTHAGFALVIASALSWSIANMFVKRIRSDQPLAVVVWGSVAAALVLLPIAIVIDGAAAIPTALQGMGWKAGLGLAFQAWPTTLLAFGIWAWLLRKHPAALIAPFTLLVPVVGMAGATVLLNEELAWWKLAGAALVLGGIALNVFVARAATRRQ